jgi:hypothetical protein
VKTSHSLKETKPVEMVFNDRRAELFSSTQPYFRPIHFRPEFSLDIIKQDTIVCQNRRKICLKDR